MAFMVSVFTQLHSISCNLQFKTLLLSILKEVVNSLQKKLENVIILITEFSFVSKMLNTTVSRAKQYFTIAAHKCAEVSPCTLFVIKTLVMYRRCKRTLDLLPLILCQVIYDLVVWHVTKDRSMTRLIGSKWHFLLIRYKVFSISYKCYK